MDWIVFCLIFVLNGDFCRKFLKSAENHGLLLPAGRKILTRCLIIYFLIGVILRNDPLLSVFFYTAPTAGLLSWVFFWKKRKERTLLENLYSLPIPLTAQMKLGLGFMDAWDKSLQTVENPAERQPLLKISDSLRFQRACNHPHPEINSFLHHLLSARKSDRPLKQIMNLQRKIQVKLLFLRRSRQVLFQLRLQSGVMAILYGGLVCWNLAHYGFQHFSLIFLSFPLFFIGLVWIFKMGKTLKWSL